MNLIIIKKCFYAFKRIALYVQEIPNKINDYITWSHLSGIGNSAPARLTILAPLIGYLVIYNQAIAQIFYLSKNNLEAIDASYPVLGLLRDLKLTFLYFGLTLFGVGAVIFAIFAPKSIKKYKSPEEYVIAMEAAQTEWHITDTFTRVARRSIRDYDFETYGDTTLSFTYPTIAQLDDILEFAGHNSGFEDPDGTSDDAGFYNALGNIERAKVLDCILGRRRVDRAIWHNAVGAIAENRARDVYYMAYTHDEWASFLARLICALFFAIGSVLLVIPTIITSVEVISQIGR